MGAETRFRSDKRLASAYALSIYPPPSIDRRLARDLTVRGLPLPHRFHLTLKYSFLPSATRPPDWEALERLIASHGTLHLRTTGLLASDATFCHLLLVAQDQELMRLHSDVMTILEHAGQLTSPQTSEFEGAGYNPHITVGYGSSEDDFAQQHALFQEYEPRFEFEARSVELVRSHVGAESENEKHEIVRSFSLAT